ncbi:hypothetical protein KORDIASMS9_03710 [Kordia sp. SMS9]|uniref:hypothetical protein n=1 Tax=Kordia sp. SMS9 TaxID=2282170 RepID=UPI000E0D9998|nr:hypothetical protein [Kordia sp. SMS9]AXG71453.1 hypothetical protein KORDIASMS9_03710 [Kordia sp. SMS9]
MISIDDTLPNVIKAKAEHYKVINIYLRRSHLQKNTPVTDFIKDNLDNLINGKPDELQVLNKQFYDAIPQHSTNGYEMYLTAIEKKKGDRTQSEKRLVTKYNKLRKKLYKIINYEDWFISSPKLYAYQLAENLDRTTCTYCNRLYTNTVKTKDGAKVMRPQFDHWFPKSKFPLLALSFYNLIPSCSVCNSSTKGDTLFELNSHYHPYDKDILDKFTFSYDYEKSLDEYTVKIAHNTADIKAEKTFKDLNLATIYNAHTSELKDLITIEKKYTKSYIDTIQKSYPSSGLSYDEVYRLAFGTEYKEENFHQRPFSKFKKDILAELKIIPSK